MGDKDLCGHCGCQNCDQCGSCLAHDCKCGEPVEKTREQKVEALIQYWTDMMDLDALIEFYQHHQREFLSTKTDAEVNEIYTTEEVEEIL